MNRKRQWLKAAAWVLAVVVVLAAAAVFAGLQLAQQKMQRKVDIKVQPVPGATGDQALAHLAQVARECMRPQDTLARYGGEEFVLMLPDTPLEKGIEAMTRLQRELTKRFFLAGAEKILITFSAGVAQVGVDEDGAAAIKRADQAMYMAKRAGKNRVLGA